MFIAPSAEYSNIAAVTGPIMQHRFKTIFVSRPPPDCRQLVSRLLLHIEPTIGVSVPLLRLDLSVGTKDAYNIAANEMIWVLNTTSYLTPTHPHNNTSEREGQKHYEDD